MLARSRVRAPVIVGEFDVGMYSEDERGLDPRREFASRDLDMARAYVLSMAFLLAGCGQPDELTPFEALCGEVIAFHDKYFDDPVFVEKLESDFSAILQHCPS